MGKGGELSSPPQTKELDNSLRKPSNSKLKPNRSLGSNDPPKTDKTPERGFYLRCPVQNTWPLEVESSPLLEVCKHRLDSQWARKPQRRFCPRKEVCSKNTNLGTSRPDSATVRDFPSLSFFICKMGRKIVHTSKSCSED